MFLFHLSYQCSNKASLLCFAIQGRAWRPFVGRSSFRQVLEGKSPCQNRHFKRVQLSCGSGDAARCVQRAWLPGSAGGLNFVIHHQTLHSTRLAVLSPCTIVVCLCLHRAHRGVGREHSALSCTAYAHGSRAHHRAQPPRACLEAATYPKVQHDLPPGAHASASSLMPGCHSKRPDASCCACTTTIL